jgi:long-chain acyl-CoA synthetase
VSAANDTASGNPEDVLARPFTKRRPSPQGRAAAYKYRRQIWIVDELPKGPTGKIAKRQIKMPLQ